MRLAQSIIYKLRKCGISGSLLAWFSNYLTDRQQRVVVNGQSSAWSHITAGVPQGSVLGPLLFLLYINDITQEVSNCHIRLFADDTCLFIEVNDRATAAEQINTDLQHLSQWADKWLVTFSPPKTKLLTISNKKDAYRNPPITFHGYILKEVPHHTYLGLKFTNTLRWNHHISDFADKGRTKLNLMLPLKFKIDRKSLEIMYNAFVRPTMEYASIVWGGSYDSDLYKLEQVHIDAMRLITCATAKSNIAKLFEDTGWLTLKERRDKNMLTMLYKIKNNLAPNYLHDLLPPETREYTTHNLRHGNNIVLPSTRLKTFKRSFIPFSIRLWNALSVEVRHAPSLNDFKNHLHKDNNEPNVLYYYGSRWASVHHTRICLGCSKLNYDLCFNLHVIDNPSCACGATYENSHHFFCDCPFYNDIRPDLKNAVQSVATFDNQNLLYGNKNLSDEENIVIFDAVHTYITKSMRFV